MGSGSRRQRYGTEAWNRSAALDNIDKHIHNPTIKEGRITKAVVANNRSSLSSNVHTLSNPDEDESGLHNTFLDYDHSKQSSSPSSPSSKKAYRKLLNGTPLGIGDSAASGARHDASSYASRAAAFSAKEGARKPSTVGYSDPAKNMFEALAQGNMHPRAPSPNRSAPNARDVRTNSSLPPHKHVPSSNASLQASESSIEACAPHLRQLPTFSSQRPMKPSRRGPSPAETAAKSFSLAHNLQPLAYENNVKLSMPMNAGLKDKSAAKDSAFPCSFRDCTRGFLRAKDLKRHKAAEHEWCSVCDLDCEDDVALIEHRIASTLAEEGKHIACLKCGDDFGCEAGRKRHTQMEHREVQEIVCAGCGEVFERAAGLLAHVSSNRCKDRSGLVSEAVYSKGRVDAALEMEQLAVTNNNLRFATETGSVDESITNGPGGVGVTQSLLDKDDEAIQRRTWAGDRGTSDDGMGSETSAKDAGDASSDTIEGLDNLSVADSKKSATTQGWTRALFPDAKATPVQGGWTQPRAQPSILRGGRGDTGHTASLSIIGGRPVRTDWDYFIFEHDAMDRLKCPFQRCDFTYVDEAAVKAHLISGYHQGTAQQCVKCLKTFKNPVALLAHMESASVKCNVRDTEQYGHILYMVSGGFIDVNDDERGTRLADGQLRMRARTKAELAEQEARREEEQRQRERQLAAQW